MIHTKTETQFIDDTWRFMTPAGQMICESVGRERVFIIGLAYGKGSYWRNWQKGPDSRSVDVVPDPKGGTDGIEPILGTVKNFNYFLHWDRIPTGSLFTTSTFWMRENDYFIKIKPTEWDACIYLKETEPATPCSSTE